MSEEGFFHRVAIFDEKSKSVILAESKEQALAELRKLLGQNAQIANPTVQAETKSIAFEVERREAEGTRVILFSSKMPNRVFVAERALGAHVGLTREGDTVTLTYVDTGEIEIPVHTLTNEKIFLRRPEAPAPKR